MVNRVASGVTMAEMIKGRHDGMLTVMGQYRRRDHADPGQNGQHQWQFKCTTEDQEEFDVEIDIGADTERGRDVAIHTEADKKSMTSGRMTRLQR